MLLVVVFAVVAVVVALAVAVASAVVVACRGKRSPNSIYTNSRSTALAAVNGNNNSEFSGVIKP